MENTIELENKENIEKILKDFEGNDTIRVKHIECLAGCKDGDNYMSVVKRIIANGTYNNKQDYRRSIIIKRQIASLQRRQLFRCDIAFTNEMAAYEYVIPYLRQIADENNQQLPLPHCLFAGTDAYGDLIALEDLAPSGYRMANRLKGLDYGHCKIVMQELGVLHATSRAMKQCDPKTFWSMQQNLNEFVYSLSAIEFYTHSLESSLKEALFSLRKSNVNGDLDIPIQKIDCLTGKLFQIMFDCVVGSDDEWTVLCHGDLWINNLLFKYDETNVCHSVKLVDLQTMRYSSPAIDILHFLYTSTEYAVREKYYDQLLMDYTLSFYDTVQKLTGQYDRNAIDLNYELNGIRSQLRKKALYGLGICMWLMPAVTFHPDKIPDLNEISLDDFTNSKQEKTMTQMQTPEYHARMKETVLEFYNKGYLDCLY